MFNLCVITIERYVTIVHFDLAQERSRPWMIYDACVSSWLNGIIINFTLEPTTTIVIDGTCVSVRHFPKPSSNDRVRYLVLSLFVRYSPCHVPIHVLFPNVTTRENESG